MLGFSKYLGNNAPVLAQFTAVCKGTTRQILTREDFKSIVISLPPIDEQVSIAAFLDRETAIIDVLMSKTREAIAYLREYRVALISAAVTGKIDVLEVRISGQEPY